MAGARTLSARLISPRNATNGKPFGRPPLGDPSRYLLTNLALCGCCGGPLRVRSRSHGNGRKQFYGCSAYHERGRTVCENGADVPMTDANDIVIEALLDDVLDETMIAEAVDAAVGLIQGEGDVPERLEVVEAAIRTVSEERTRLAAAIASGGQLSTLLDALQGREARQAELEAERSTLRSWKRLEASETGRVREELLALAGQWRQVLANDPLHSRPIVSSLLKGRVVITPGHDKKRWTLSGEGTFAGLFQGGSFPVGLASPTRMTTPVPPVGGPLPAAA